MARKPKTKNGITEKKNKLKKAIRKGKQSTAKTGKQQV
jgi:hypothetical protein